MILTTMIHRTRKIVTDVALFAVSQVLFYAAFKVSSRLHPASTIYLIRAVYAHQAVMGQMDPQSNKRKEAKDKSKKALGKLGLDLTTLELTEHEEIMAAEVVHPNDISTNFKGEARAPAQTGISRGS